jgi:hypothetical protein
MKEVFAPALGVTKRHAVRGEFVERALMAVWTNGSRRFKRHYA